MVRGRTLQKEIPLTHFPFRIGRTRQADLPIPHSLVSRQHCEIDTEDDWLVVYDVGSSNGTRVNDEKVESAYLQPGDELTVGPLTFVARYDVHDGADQDDDVYEDEVEPAAAGSSAVDLGLEDEVPEQEPAAAGTSVVDLSLDDLLDSNDLSGVMDSDVIAGSAHDTDLEADAEPAEKTARTKAVEDSDDANFNAADLLADHKPDDEDSILDDDFGKHDDMEPQDSGVLPISDSDDVDKAELATDSKVAEAMQGLSVASDSATAKKPTRGDSSEEPQFPLRLRLTDAGSITKGTPVRAAGVQVGLVKDVSWAEADGELFAEAQLKVQQRLAAVLRSDARVSIQQHDGKAVVMIESPGRQGPHAKPGQLYKL